MMLDSVKDFKDYSQQLEVLEDRGMEIGDHEEAIAMLRRVNYYRLSGYWYPFRQITTSGRDDRFYPGTRFSDVVALYDFDSRLRVVTFAALVPVELAIRARLGHELGRVDPCVHLEPEKLGVLARSGDQYSRWVKRYENELQNSREDFVQHHQNKYGGKMPVWVATELLDWGSLTYLYGFAPRVVHERVADLCGLSAPQLTSWMKALNLVRNTCAHHGRLFNRVHTIVPKLPALGRHPQLDAVAVNWSRTFGQRTLIQFLADRLGIGTSNLLTAVVKTYPTVRAVPPPHMGIPPDWQNKSSLWG